MLRSKLRRSSGFGWFIFIVDGRSSSVKSGSESRVSSECSPDRDDEVDGEGEGEGGAGEVENAMEAASGRVRGAGDDSAARSSSPSSLALL